MILKYQLRQPSDSKWCHIYTTCFSLLFLIFTNSAKNTLYTRNLFPTRHIERTKCTRERERERERERKGERGGERERKKEREREQEIERERESDRGGIRGY